MNAAISVFTSSTSSYWLGDKQAAADDFEQAAAGQDHQDVKDLVIAKHRRERVGPLAGIGQRSQRVQHAAKHV